MEYKNSFEAISDLSLYMKVIDNDDLKLADVPKIISLRWTYFRDNWEFIRIDLENNADRTDDAQAIYDAIADMTNFIKSQRSSVNKISNPFDNSNIYNKFYPIFNAMSINSLSLSKEEEVLSDEAVSKVQNFTRQDMLDIRNRIQKDHDLQADKIGGTDADYNASVYRSPVIVQFSKTSSSLVKFKDFFSVIRAVDLILVNFFHVEKNLIDRFALARANANNPDFDISQYSSGYLITMNKGEDLQKIAARHLGSADKWIDIAIANGLKAPYIDEVGRKVDLLSNGSGNQLNLPAMTGGILNKDELHVGSVVFLQSDIEKSQETRSILNIREIAVSGELVLELDGESDLDKYRVDEGAYVRVFKPNTINSAFFLLIPTEDQLQRLEKDPPWFLKLLPEDERKLDIDLQIDKNNDLVLTSTSDVKLSYGIENAVQAIKLKLQTELGEILRHPAYGFVSVMGQTNNISVRAVITESIRSQIAADTRFDRLEDISVLPIVVQGGSLATRPSGYGITMTVRLAGGGGKLIPISFSVNNG